ncbi:hypothetical protein [Sagittula salina]|uniref:Uncharacterized protein n=1 Tax=Sagittula salina TaxID=2820268 RepID=A0A940S4S0_9RHOB|nr:hypothetical protein [Sagittula salina]MBP0484175.1 hypothetical protein [Sagittula salina]
MAEQTHVLSPDAYRWKAGHRLFFTHIQGLVLAIDAFERRPSEDRLDDVTDLLLGSVVMMQFAADFIDEGYDWVRNDMAKVHEDFSGVFSADHAELLKRLRGMRSAKDNFAEAHGRFAAALNTVYNAHAFVCRRFVADSGSLANPEVNAPELLRTKFLRRALVTAGATEQARELDRRGQNDA